MYLKGRISFQIFGVMVIVILLDPLKWVSKVNVWMQIFTIFILEKKTLTLQKQNNRGAARLRLNPQNPLRNGRGRVYKIHIFKTFPPSHAYLQRRFYFFERQKKSITI